MKRTIAFLMFLMLITGLFAGCSQEAQTNTEQVIKIGVFEPFPGENASGGKQEALGIAYANAVQPTVTINGVTYKVELVVANNESSSEKAPTAAADLVDHGVSVVLGSYGSDEAMAGSAVFEAAGIPAVGVTCTNPAITAGNQHYFRICWLDTFQGSVLAKFAEEQLKAKTVYCLAEQEPLIMFLISDLPSRKEQKSSLLLFQRNPQPGSLFRQGRMDWVCPFWQVIPGIPMLWQQPDGMPSRTSMSLPSLMRMSRTKPVRLS